MKDKSISFLILLVTCIVPLITTVELKSIMYYCIGICLVILLFLKRHELKFDNIDKMLFAFFILTCISTIFSTDIKVSIFGAKIRYEGLLMYTVYFLLFYTSKYFFKPFKHYFTILFISASIICIYSILQFYDIMPIHKLLDIEYKKHFASRNIS